MNTLRKRIQKRERIRAVKNTIILIFGLLLAVAFGGIFGLALTNTGL